VTAGGWPDRERRWLKRFGPRKLSARTRLLCFHYAGGNAGSFRRWAARLPCDIEVIAVQLPGRADRFLEAPFDRMQPLIDELIDVTTPLLSGPFACYGVSMGARVGWAMAHGLRERAMPAPRALYVSASGGPSLDDGDWPWEGRSDGLEGYIREMGGTPEAVLAEPALLAALLPTLSADLTVLSTHGFQPRMPLDIPVRAFAGAEDDEATPDRMKAWAAETSGQFELTVYACGHFFDPDSERSMIEAIGADLS
jgi:medium-chain acyl-[acyl-carrier-protein] hydrolase